MLLPFLILLAIGVIYIIGVMLLRNSQELTILWGQDYTVETSTFTVVVGLVVSLVLGYLLLMGLSWLFKLPKRNRQHKQFKRQMTAQLGMKNGLIKMLEGHWADGEKDLLDNVTYSDNPLLNYLAAARASQMQGHYHQRDDYLKKASGFGQDAEVAVAVSQASMQLDAGQIEQARATLTHLRELSPNHPIPNQLLAKVYYQQEDWKQLAQLMPVLLLQSEGSVDSKKHKKFMQRAVVGLFETTSGKQDIVALESIWQTLPAQVKQETYAVEAYATALTNAGGGDLAAPLLEARLAQQAERRLYACYGKIHHRHPSIALAKANAWVARDETDPALLLCLARLQQQCENYSVSADYYERALTLVPDQQVYYEFAELLLLIGDVDNANRCNRQGLRYCVQGKAIPFIRS